MNRERTKLILYSGHRKKLIVPEGITSIGDLAFAGLDNLQSVTLPDSLEELGDGVHYQCSNLQKFLLNGNHPYLAVIGDVLYRKKDKTLMACPAKLQCDALAVPHGIVKVNRYAFAFQHTLNSIALPDTLTEIDMHAFMKCMILHFSLPASLQMIGQQAFIFCECMQNLVLPDNIQEIP